MLGFYPDCPGEPFYTLTIPTFDRAEIDTANGKLVIEKAAGIAGASAKAGDRLSLTLGGRRLGSYRISHRELIEGQRLVFRK